MDITVRVLITENVNFAAYHCGYLPIRSIHIKNGAGKTAILRIYSEPEFLYEYKTELVLDSDDIKNRRAKGSAGCILLQAGAFGVKRRNN